MRKYIISALILLCFSYGMIKPIEVYAANNFKEGVYRAADFNASIENTYFVQNISNKDNIHIFIFDENQLEIQSIQLDPSPRKYNLIPLKPDYRIAIVGKGEAYIDIS